MELPYDMLNEIYEHCEYMTKCVLKFVNKMFYSKDFKVNIRKIISMLNNNLIPGKIGLPSFCWKKVIQTHLKTKYINGHYSDQYKYARALCSDKVDEMCDEAEEFYKDHILANSFPHFEECNYDYYKLVTDIEKDESCEFITQYPGVDIIEFGYGYVSFYYDDLPIFKKYNLDNSMKLVHEKNGYLVHDKNGYVVYKEDISSHLSTACQWNRNEVDENGYIIFKNYKFINPSQVNINKLYGQYSFYRNGAILYDRCYEKCIKLEPVVKQMFGDCISALSLYDLNIHNCMLPRLFEIGFYENTLSLSSQHAEILFNNFPVRKYRAEKYHEWVKYKTWIGKMHDGNVILYEISLSRCYYQSGDVSCKIKPKKHKMRRLDALIIYSIKPISHFS